MKVAVMNLSGNVGKSTVAKHLVLPRIPGADLVAVETINADEGDEDKAKVKGKDFGALIEELMSVDAAVVDIGASNVEDVLKLMAKYEGSHEDFDLFVIPVTREAKQIKDTMATIATLEGLGVPPGKIRVVFNKVEDADEDVAQSFASLFQFHARYKNFTLNRDAKVLQNELFQMLRTQGTSVEELVADATDWKAKLRETEDEVEKKRVARMLSMKRLATSAKKNLDAAWAAVQAA